MVLLFYLQCCVHSYTMANFDYLSSETVSLFLPLRRRAANTFLPLAVDILLRKPCLLALFLSEGWNVLFIFVRYLLFIFCAFLSQIFTNLRLQKYVIFFNWTQKNIRAKTFFCLMCWKISVSEREINSFFSISKIVSIFANSKLSVKNC